MIKEHIRRRYNKLIARVSPSSEPYKTHMPILLRLATAIRPKRIAEFGMGFHSTGLFLDRDLFPTVEELVSFEDDPGWFKVIEKQHRTDPRFDGRLVKAPMWKTAAKLKSRQFDLIFVDDSKTESERAKTILGLRLSPGITRGPVVVVHDVELPRLRSATLLYPRRVYFANEAPQTGVLCVPSGIIVQNE